MDGTSTLQGAAGDERAALDAAIEGLYVAFAAEPLRPWTEPCLHCCTSPEEEAALHAVPLRDLTPDAIRPYAANAMTTWGDERELRHLLPRLFEVAATQDLGWPDIEVLIGTLATAQWQLWPDHQRAAVDAYLVALWFLTIASPHPVHDVDAVLCAIGRAVDDLDPFLAWWIDDPRPTAARHLVELVNDRWSASEHRLTNAFWSNRPDQRTQVARWLGSAAVHIRIVDVATAPGDDRLATEAGWALARLPGTSVDG